MFEKIIFLFSELRNAPNRIIANYLRRRGWVVFYLDERSRQCNGETCWLKLYQESEKKTK